MRIAMAAQGSPKPGAGRKGIHPALFYGMFTLLLAGNAGLGTAFVFSPDISRLLNGKTEQVIEAYEDRIAQLRVEVDRLHSRSYAQAGDINLQLQELSQQQEELLEQHQLVRVLVDKADQLGIKSASSVSDEPQHHAETLRSDGNPDIDATAASIRQMMGETQSAMTAIAENATARTDEIVSELGDLGIAVPLPAADDAVGGPLLPPRDGEADQPLIEDANTVLAALVRYQAARASMEAAPVHMPIAGNYRRSSGFGNRTDPFTGGRAFHAGLDFAAPQGTTVLSAGDGIITYVGQKSGYGNLVEITHPSGLVTRYGHLSSFIGEQGQRVVTGTPIARVGSTGRSTGPHLHFEVRKADTAIDPKIYLDAGKRLMALL